MGDRLFRRGQEMKREEVKERKIRGKGEGGERRGKREAFINYCYAF